MLFKYTDKEKDVMASAEDTMLDICAGVSGGNTLPEWCETHDVRYGAIAAWVNCDPDRLSAYAKATLMRADWFEQTVFKQLRAIANVDLRTILNEDGELRPVSEWPVDTARALQGIDIEEIFNKDGESNGKRKKIKLADKLKAIELIMKNRRMLSERIEHSGKVSLEELLSQSITPVEK